MAKFECGDIVTVEAKIVGIVSTTRVCLKLPGKDRPVVTIENDACTLIRRRPFEIGERVIVNSLDDMAVIVRGVYENKLWVSDDAGITYTVSANSTERC